MIYCDLCRACSQNALFGMGNPLLDISAVVDKDFLDKWVLCVTADGRSAVFKGHVCVVCSYECS